MRTFAALALAAAALGIASDVAGDEPAAPIERSAYLSVGGSLSLTDRAVEHELRAQAARAAGDAAADIRNLVMACLYRSQLGPRDPELSPPVCERARTGAADAGLVDARVALLAIEGNLRAWRLEIREAMALLNEALELGADLDAGDPDAFGVRSARFTRGALSVELGYWDAGIHDLEVVARDAAAAGDDAHVAWADTWACRAYLLLGDVDSAGQRCGAARAYIDRTEDAHVAMTLPWLEGDLAGARGSDADALAHYRDGWSRIASDGDTLRPTYAIAIAHALIERGSLDEADAWIADLERASAAGDLPAQTAPQVARQRGRLELARGNSALALAAFERAAETRLHGLSVRAHLELSRARRAAGDVAGARAALEEAVARIETGRAAIEGAAARVGYADLHADVYRDLIRSLWEEHGASAAARALSAAEASRARALADALALADSAGHAAPTLSAADVQEHLSDGELLIEYVAGEQMFAVAATRDELVFVALPADAAELARRVSFFRQLVIEATDDQPIALPAAALWSDLVAPVLAALPDGVAEAVDTLILSPDGPLYELPFDALRADDAFVADRWRTAMVPSATALAARPARAGSGTLVIAASPADGELAPLPSVRDEAAAVVRRVSDAIVREGAAATEQEAAGAGDYAVLHFASHAIIDAGYPLRSALVMARADAGDGRWRAEEIYATRLSADLVVLSACRTAVGRLSRGEGPMSLSRAFLHAGAQATVATLWNIDDGVGPAFADELYAQLGSGAPLAEAVARARRTLRARGAPPRAWAAYVLTGPPRARVAIDTPVVDSPRRWRTAATVGLCALCLIAAVLYLRRSQSPSAGEKNT